LSLGQDPTEELYKQFHINSNSINNCFQFYYNRIAEQKVQILMLTKKIDELERKLKEFEPLQKKHLKST